jgi:hypothetical protein
LRLDLIEACHSARLYVFEIEHAALSAFKSVQSGLYFVAQLRQSPLAISQQSQSVDDYISFRCVLSGADLIGDKLRQVCG